LREKAALHGMFLVRPAPQVQPILASIPKRRLRGPTACRLREMLSIPAFGLRRTEAAI